MVAASVVVLDAGPLGGVALLDARQHWGWHACPALASMFFA